MEPPGDPALEVIVTGIPCWLLREYLLELGGRVDGHDGVRGDGWRAHLMQVDDHRVGSIRVGRVRLEVWADAEVLARLRPALARKLLRAGG